MTEVRLGDSTEIMRSLPSATFDAVVTDPPYGTGKHGYGRQSLGARTIANDLDLSELERAAPEMFRLLKSDTWAVVFCSARFRSATEQLLEGCGFTYYGEVIWDKRMPSLGYTLRYQHESAVVVKKGDAPKPEVPLFSVHSESIGRDAVRDAHPHRKPQRLMEKLVSFACPRGGVVLDPFAGEGTCGAAAITVGRQYLGIEIDPQWHARASARLTGSSEQYMLTGAA